MNKRELIERMKGLKNLFGNKPEYVETDTVIELISGLDEPKPVKVKQFVADWYEEHKDEFEYNVWDWLSSKNELEKIDSEFAFWLNDVDNTPIQTLVNMHQFGYEVEKEKRYTVVMKKTKQPLYYNAGDRKLFFSLGGLATIFTQQQLEHADFGWVFDCPGIKIEEVKD